MEYRYVETHDGTRVAYRVVGNPDGFPLVLTNGIGCPESFFHPLVDSLSSRARILLWHKRGHGRSSLPKDYRNCRIEDSARDLAGVMAHAGFPPAVHLGYSMGVQVVLEHYAVNPGGVRGLVLVCGTAGPPLTSFFNNFIVRGMRPLLPLFIRNPLLAGVRAAWYVGNSLHALDLFLAKMLVINPELVREQYWHDFFNAYRAMDVKFFLLFGNASAKHSFCERFSTVRVPALVVSARRDVFVPFWVGQTMAREIPGAEFHALAEASHLAMIEVPEEIGRVMAGWIDRKFLHPERRHAPPGAVIS